MVPLGHSIPKKMPLLVTILNIYYTTKDMLINIKNWNTNYYLQLHYTTYDLFKKIKYKYHVNQCFSVASNTSLKKKML